VRRLLCSAGVLSCAALGLVSSGCSTVVFTQNETSDRDSAVEREALVNAASAIAETKWPQPQSASWAARLTGAANTSELTSKDEAVDTYIASLGTPPGRQATVYADAARHLKAANELVDAAKLAAESIRPLTADVAVVEDAISELRENRDIYLACLKELAHQGEMIETTDVRALKAEFNQALEAIGDAADLLADKASQDRTETVARSTERLNLNGSL
jgi:hypothetical protein